MYKSVIVLMILGTLACGSETGAPTSGTPALIHDKNRKVTDLEFVVTEAPRNACSRDVRGVITQYVPLKSTCGELPDEVGNLEDLDPKFLSISQDCTLDSFWNTDETCAVTNDLTCELSTGCTESRHLDFDWSPVTDDPKVLKINEAFLGDGILKMTRSCPGKPDCEGEYRVTAYTLLD